MKSPLLAAVLAVGTAVAGFGQAIPYAMLKAVDECAKELRRAEGVKAELKLEHANPSDKREYQLWLETPADRQVIAVNADGSFLLPEVPADLQAQARVIHSLEKGALRISFGLQCSGSLPRTDDREATTFYEGCSVVADGFRKLEPALVRLSQWIPSFADYQIAIVGVSLLREKPCAGVARLKDGDRTVATVDLSQTGKVTWMFSNHDPRKHRLVFEMKDGQPAPQVSMEFQMGRLSADAKGAILVRRLK